MQDKRIIEAWDALVEVVKDLTPLEVGAITCMLIDYAAVLGEMSSVEFIKEITPMIRDVNEQLGTIDIHS